MLSPFITVAVPLEETMLSTQAFEVPKAQIDAALKRGRRRTAVARAETEVALVSARNAMEAGLIEPVLIADPPEARLASVALAMMV